MRAQKEKELAASGPVDGVLSKTTSIHRDVLGVGPSGSNAASVVTKAGVGKKGKPRRTAAANSLIEKDAAITEPTLSKKSSSNDVLDRTQQLQMLKSSQLSHGAMSAELKELDTDLSSLQNSIDKIKAMQAQMLRQLAEMQEILKRLAASNLYISKQALLDAGSRKINFGKMPTDKEAWNGTIEELQTFARLHTRKGTQFELDHCTAQLLKYRKEEQVNHHGSVHDMLDVAEDIVNMPDRQLRDSYIKLYRYCYECCALEMARQAALEANKWRC